jgi:hypothetical protein
MRELISTPAILGPIALADAERRLADYLLDPCGDALAGAADDPWLAQSLLLVPVAPGFARPVAEDLAAVIAAPQLIDGARLSQAAISARFTGRADDAIAAAVATLEPSAAVAAIRALAAAPGPDEDRLHLALLQAGRALAWRPELAGGTARTTIIDPLIALVDRTSPEPLLAAIAPILGALGAAASPVAAHVCDAILARFAAAKQRITGRRAATSFLGELRALDKPRALSDEDYYITLPDRQVAQACARIAGRAAAGRTRDGFVVLQTAVLEDELGTSLLPAFVDGLIDGAALAPLAELVTHLLASADEDARLLALYVAARIPLDDAADACLECLADRRPRVRVRAARAATLVAPERAVPALSSALDDADPGVCATAARGLVELGRRDLIEERRMPIGVAIGRARERTAAIRAAIGDTSVDVMSALMAIANAEAERDAGLEARPDAGGSDGAPLTDALGTMVRGTAAGLRIAVGLMREAPGALPLLALALAGIDGTPSVALAPELRAELAAVLDPIIAGGGDAGMLALETLCRFSRGDAAMIERILAAGAREDGYAQMVLASLAHVRVRGARAADSLAPWLDHHEHVGATMLAAGVAGLVMPVDHPLWARVAELAELGTVGASAVYTAFGNRARVRCGQ